MKRQPAFLLSFLVLLLLSCSSKPGGRSKYTYETYKNDPIQTKVYTLKNGLTVYMSVNKDAPRISTSIAVRTGSKNDPADATGLAHYLEHMLFKGTDKYGTLDYSKEEPLLNKVEELYEVYRTKTDKKEREAIYRQIDSVSQEASKYAIANEYDKMMSEMGATGTNAFTSFDQTVYINDIPSNQLKRWLEMEAERFRKPVLRLFHTELEAVYEEKNIGLDDDAEKVFETLFANLFPNHNYGKQTTIGTVEHLKNPSIKKIKEYFNTYYVPNNMAIILTGDFEPDSAVTWIEKYFGSYVRKDLPQYSFQPEKGSPEPIVKTVLGPEEESVTVGFRFTGAGSDDALMIELVDMILANSTAGLIDLNLVQEQKVLSATSYHWDMADYVVEFMEGTPKQGQSLEEVKNLLIAQIDSVKKGAFPDWLLPAIVKDLRLSQTRNLEDNWGRNYMLMDVFINKMKYEEHVNRLDRMAKITKQDVMKFANEKLNNDYVVVYKKTGQDPDVVKVEKPKITPVDIKRDTASAFMKYIVDQQVKPIEPVFVDYKKEVTEKQLQEGMTLYYHQNTTNNLFELTYLIDIGSRTDKVLPIAVSYLDFLGTEKYSPVAIKQEFYKSGCSFNVFTGTDKVFVTLSGLQEDFEKGIDLFEHLLDHAQPNPDALKNMVMDMIKKRNDTKLSKDYILWNGLMNYGKYGQDNPFTYVLSDKEMQALADSTLINIIHSLKNYQHRILYYGPAKVDEISGLISKYHKVPASLQSVPAERQYAELEAENKVYLVNYDMQQAEIIMLTKDVSFDASMMPVVSLFNEYFGGSMCSVVFQEIRESKAYAYSAYSGYTQPRKPQESYYLFSYLGTQADKMPEAMNAMVNILDSMPQSEKNLETCRKNILENIRTTRISKSGVLWAYETNRRMGFDHDMRKDVYEGVPKLTMKDLLAFQQQHIKGRKKFILIVGDKRKLDMNTLKQYGPVTELSLAQVFGY